MIQQFHTTDQREFRSHVCNISYITHLDVLIRILSTHSTGYLQYCMEGNFGGGKRWRIDSFRAFGERKLGELIYQPIDY